MKTKRTFLSILTLCIALLFTACSGKGTAGTEKSQNTKQRKNRAYFRHSCCAFSAVRLFSSTSSVSKLMNCISTNIN